MFFDLLFQIMEPSQIAISFSAAVFSIVFSAALARMAVAFATVFLPAILSFLVNLVVLIFLFLLFLSAIFVFAVVSSIP